MKKTNYKMAVNVDGTLFVVTDGHVSGEDRGLVQRVKDSVYLGDPVQLVVPFGDHVMPNLDPDDPVGALAALASLSARWEILGDIPEAVSRFLSEQNKRYGEGSKDLGEGLTVPAED